MGTLHDLIEARGRQAVLALDFQRSSVEAAVAYMANEETSIGYLYSGWTQAALPHKRLPDDQPWQITSDRVMLVVEPGRRPSLVEGQPLEFVGVPYGSRARLILLYLQTEALRTGSREIPLGKSLRTWMACMGIPAGGKSIEGVRDQAERISRCRLTFHAAVGGGNAALLNQNIVDTGMFSRPEAEQRGAFLEVVRLSEGFFDALQRHPVPLEDAAIRAIANNSMALDIYCWLAYRLHALKAARPISWAALKSQFGAAYGQLSGFKPRFLGNLDLALAVYRDAKVEVSQDGTGVVLWPSKPPVTPRSIATR